MTDNENWLLETIVAKSDQLNAVDLIGGPITVAVQSVKKGEQDQPVIIGIGVFWCDRVVGVIGLDDSEDLQSWCYYPSANKLQLRITVNNG